jgi:hypothetical protein
MVPRQGGRRRGEWGEFVLGVSPSFGRALLVQDQRRRSRSEIESMVGAVNDMAVTFFRAFTRALPAGWAFSPV